MVKRHNKNNAKINPSPLSQCESISALAEEAGIAYRDISEVVETMDVLGISKKVVQLKPIGNIKG